jgi:hypothetical protein
MNNYNRNSYAGSGNQASPNNWAHQQPMFYPSRGQNIMQGQQGYQHLYPPAQMPISNGRLQGQQGYQHPYPPAQVPFSNGRIPVQGQKPRYQDYNRQQQFAQYQIPGVGQASTQRQAGFNATPYPQYMPQNPGVQQMQPLPILQGGNKYAPKRLTPQMPMQATRKISQKVVPAMKRQPVKQSPTQHVPWQGLPTKRKREENYQHAQGLPPKRKKEENDQKQGLLTQKEKEEIDQKQGLPTKKEKEENDQKPATEEERIRQFHLDIETESQLLDKAMMEMKQHMCMATEKYPPLPTEDQLLQLFLAGPPTRLPYAKVSVEEKMERDIRSVYVKHLDYSVREDNLKQHFHGSGAINAVNIKRNDQYLSATAIIEFADKASMENALLFDRTYLQSKRISVEIKKTRLPKNNDKVYQAKAKEERPKGPWENLQEMQDNTKRQYGGPFQSKDANKRPEKKLY